MTIQQYIRKRELKQAMFLSGYWLWCFVFLLVAIFEIVNGGALRAMVNGVIQSTCLIIATVWIEGLLNDT